MDRQPAVAEFEPAVAVVLEHEGGYVCDPADPGGETRFGISRRSYPDLDISALTRQQAIEIYRRDFWRYPAIADQAVASKLLDMAVNLGPRQAHTLLQRALNAVVAGPVAVDGRWGPETLAFVNAAEPERLLPELRALCAEYYCRLALGDRTKAKFLLGWLRRAVS